MFLSTIIAITATLTLAAGLELQADPSTVIPGNAQFMLLCSKADTSNLAMVNLMQIFKAAQDGTTLILAEHVLGTPGPVVVNNDLSPRAQVSGDLTLPGPVTLNLTIYQPHRGDGGRYGCTVGALDKQYHLVTNTTYTDVVFEDYNYLALSILDLQADVEMLKNRTSACCHASSTGTIPTSAAPTAGASVSGSTPVLGGSGTRPPLGGATSGPSQGWSALTTPEASSSMAPAASTSFPTGHPELVAFSARLFSSYSDVMTKSRRVPFNVADLDTHNALNISTSTFTIPATGVYSISVTLATGDNILGSHNEADLKVNQVRQAALVLRPHFSSSLSILMTLVKGQHLTVETSEETAFKAEHFTFISAFLLH